MSARGRRSAVVVVVLGMLGLGLAGVRHGTAGTQPGDGVWQPSFAESRGLVANEVDGSTSADRVPRSPDWIVTSGSLFSDDGAGWTGRIDGRTPDPQSARATGSAVFRMVSQPTFRSCVVAFDLRLENRTATRRTPARDYDGVHVFVRYRDAGNLYAVSVARRDGAVVIKRKQAPSSGDVAQDDTANYVTLASEAAPFPLQQWRHVEVAVSDVQGGVRIALSVNGRTLLDVVDQGVDGGQPLVGPGRIGVRGDNTEFRFRAVIVTAT